MRCAEDSPSWNTKSSTANPWSTQDRTAVPRSHTRTVGYNHFQRVPFLAPALVTVCYDAVQLYLAASFITMSLVFAPRQTQPAEPVAELAPPGKCGHSMRSILSTLSLCSAT